MSELARTGGPKLPRPGLIVAVLLELCIVATFTVHHSYVGLALCGVYSWFSATWCLLRGPPDD